LPITDDPACDALTPWTVLKQGSCPKEAYIPLFITLCNEVGIQVRTVSGQPAGFDFGFEDNWVYLDLEAGQSYLNWDNETLTSSEEILGDPLLMLRNQTGSDNPYEKYARFEITGPQASIDEKAIVFQAKEVIAAGQPSQVYLSGSSSFSYTAPVFNVINLEPVSSIQWQISCDPSFKVIAIDQKELLKESIQLTPLAETFLNPLTPYWIRVRGCREGKWSEWSEACTFKIEKPERVTLVEFEKKGLAAYELNWERETEDDASIDYLVFGSNAFDFIPSIYNFAQVNRICKEGIEAEEVNNLVAVTQGARLMVDGTFAYYRIVARKHGQLSVPSSIVHIYDEDLVQPRNVLQMVEEGYKVVAKRVLFSADYPWSQVSLPAIQQQGDVFEKSLIRFYSAMRGAVLPLTALRTAYEPCPRLSSEIWENLKPYLLPENHPIKAKLDRLFSSKRVILTPETFKEAGFKRYRQGRFSRIMASPHADFPQYFFKGFPDSDVTVKADWYKLRGRIEGAKAVRTWIADNHLEGLFVVPNKWLYPLPETPAPPKSSKYLRKNFILVADNMRILDHEKNEKAYRSRMNKKMLDHLYRMLDDVGLYDSVYAFNMPFNKEGKIAIIDTEYFYRWPVPFHKLTKYFSKEMKAYWEHLIEKEGPKGHVKKHKKAAA
ncbi:MAG: hypothetical protein LW832_10220, partial [Parachlamydia sp.]|nr:hypothetical protein [Parachlamydia sp.]